MAGQYNRSLNALLAVYSYLISSVTGKAVVYGIPPAIGVELTNYCNLNCPECNTGSGRMTRKRGFMDPELFDRIISELKPFLFYARLNFQGESMMHPGFFSFLRKSRNINTVVSTNGHFLSPDNADSIVKSGLHKLIVSLDGMDQETYSKYRIGGEVRSVLDGIKNVSHANRKAGSPLKLEIQFLVNRKNEHQVHAVRHFASKMKASFRLKSMQIINSENFEEWLPSDQK
jgi:MoaA/NifB/PqqE/SkfB family radical SAM enzyme